MSREIHKNPHRFVQWGNFTFYYPSEYKLYASLLFLVITVLIDEILILFL